MIFTKVYTCIYKPEFMVYHGISLARFIMTVTVHLESCTPGQDCKLGKMVHTSTSAYQYILVTVQHGTGQYENSSFVQGGTSMYQYIPVHAFNKTCGFPTHPESLRARRDKIKVVLVQLRVLCIGYNVTMVIFKTTQN